jgi:ABC-type multidrug transport system ATPase subunit
MCTHIAVIDHGRLVAAGPVDEFIFGTNLRAVLVRVLGPAAPALEVLRRFGPARVVAENGSEAELLVELTAEPEVQADALAALVGAGVRVVSFAERASGLEEVFLQVTRGAGG